MNLTTLVSTIIHSEANLDYSINNSISSNNIIFEIQDEGNQPSKGNWLLVDSDIILASTNNDYIVWKDLD